MERKIPIIDKLNTFANIGFCVSGRTERIETFEQLINVGAGRQFSVSKAHQRKARNVVNHSKGSFSLSE